MIAVTDKRKCCGCEACAQICPRKCIKMEEDKEGFLYPSVDKSKCVECHLCETVCQYQRQNRYEFTPKTAFCFVNNDQAIREKSSSGGAFFCLAKQIIEQNGVVFGAKFDEKWNVFLASAETLLQCESFWGSKYVQARVNGSFSEVKKLLENGKKVLFSGTPCQVNGLKHFLKKEYENLLTVDFTCHAVPSPKIWRKYLSCFSKKKLISNISFRDKKVAGWNDYGLTIKSATDSLISQGNSKNLYMRGFLRYLYCRPSCSNCVSRSFQSQSDIMIGDFWRVEKYHSEKILNDNKGVSLIIPLSEKGARIVRHLSMYGYLKEVPISEAEMYGVHDCIIKSAPQHPFRKIFFLLDGIGLYLPFNIWICIEPLKRFSSIAHKIYRILKR